MMMKALQLVYPYLYEDLIIWMQNCSILEDLALSLKAGSQSRFQHTFARHRSNSRPVKFWL
jgi:hypothetical protein